MKNSLKPSHMIAIGLSAMLTASFFAVTHVGSAKRQVRGMEYGFGSRKAAEPPPETGLAANFKRGAGVISDKAGAFVHDAFSWGEDKPAGALTASARQDGAAAGNSDPADENDPFEDFYKRNYAKGSGASASAGGGSFGGFGGGSWGSSGGGSSTSGGGDDGLPAAGAAPAKESSKSSPEAEGESGKAPRANRPAVEDTSGEWVNLKRGQFGRKGGAKAQAGGGEPLQGLERAGDLSGGKLAAAPGGTGGGKLEGLSGQKGAVDLNGADEKASAGAASGYKSAIGGDSAKAAAAGGGSAGGAGGGGGGAVPAASGPKEVAADGKGGKSDTASASSSTTAGSQTAFFDSWFSPKKKGTVTASAAPPAPAFLKTIATERLKGAEADYLAGEDPAAQPEAGALKAGGVSAAAQQQQKLLAAEGQEEKPDPEKFAKLSAERKKELKKEIHVFLKRVENKYGAMTDIFFTACAAGKEVCEDHGLTEGYLTMHTKDGARLQLALKYIEKKWQPYTVSFSEPAKQARPDAPPERPAEGDSGDDSEEDSSD